ncbi:hypothetical protein VTO42DRAFT_5988 [Malbranchea cinnamomea]
MSSGLPAQLRPAHRPQPKDRRPGDPRNGDPRSGGAPVPAATASMSRAERFEDEKRRIIQSCFSKKDADGSIIESYITHIRVTEDAAYPSSPPPPKSPQENKKPRVIIVAVRKSGRVRMHKARENNDSSFSIGKTWLMDDLARIQIFEHLPASTPSEQQQREWASNLGFVVTLTKPYYWQAVTPKERDFFIGSLVKIYKKYTGGKVPELLGFDSRDREALIGAMPPGPPVSQTAKPHTSGPARPDTSSSQSRPPSRQHQRPQSPFSNRLPSRDGPKEPSKKPSREHFLRAAPSQEPLQRNYPPMLSPKTSQSSFSRDDLQSKLSDSPAVSELTPPSSLRAGQYHRNRSGDPVSDAAQNREPKESVGSRSNEERSFLTAGSDDNPPQSHETADLQVLESGVSPLKIPKNKPSLPDVSSQIHPDALRPQRGPPAKNPPQLEPPNESIDKFVTPLSSPEPSVFEAIPSSRASNKSFSNLKNEVPEPSGPMPHPTSPEEAKEDFQRPSRLSLDSKTEPLRSHGETPTHPDLPGHPVPAPLQTKTTNAPSPSAFVAEQQEKQEEEHRPGLGPMVKKRTGRDVASAFRKAATAYGAFKPRPGGAAERLLAAAKEKPSDEPDGITSVVPAPLSRGRSADTVKTTDKPPSDGTPSQPAPTIELTSEPTAKPPTLSVPSTVEAPPKSPSPSGERKRQHREDNMAKYCAALGIDPILLDGRGAEFDEILTDLGWDGKLEGEKRIEDFEADVRREIGRVQASSWLGHLELQEGKVDQLAVLLDKTIEEAEELDGLLTLYSHELNTLADDVAYIEAQSQGLQVQAANQKLLQNELQNLLKTISISSSDLRPLKEASLSNPDGVRETELALATLYKAMVTIDPDVRPNRKRLADSSGDRSGVGVYADTQLGQMRAVKEKKGEYRTEALNFLQRLRQFMGVTFKMAEQKSMDSLSRTRSETELSKYDPSFHEGVRRELWMYNALMLFAREVSTDDWVAIISLYEQQMKQSYQNEFRDIQMAWKREARIPAGDEHELLFTQQDKDREGDGLTTAARKLTVRRGRTVRAPGGLSAKVSRRADGKIDPYVAFAEVVNDTAKLISEEQNFVAAYFHLSSRSSADFPDLVSSSLPDERRCPDISDIKSFEADREVAKQLQQVMERIFSFWTGDIQAFAEWAIMPEPLQGVGAIYALERKLGLFEETNQEFLVRGLRKVHSRLMALFTKFVDEQIRAIEETKVKVKKRKGVISFMKTFPHFSMTVENMLSTPPGEVFDIRFKVNEAYAKINRAMWDSLKFIAKEAPGHQGAPVAGGGDPEDKELLNYHILMIENMNHYLEEVEIRDNIVLEEWKDRAARDMNEHLRLYMDSVIRRPLGKLLDFIESTESLLQTTSSPTEIALRPSHSRAVAKRVTAAHDSREFRRGAEALKKRVEKHFGEADDVGLSRSLVAKVLKECEARYSNIHDRARRIFEQVYEGQLELEWRMEEAVAIFKR